jgi:hypothetical protein
MELPDPPAICLRILSMNIQAYCPSLSAASICIADNHREIDALYSEADAVVETGMGSTYLKSRELSPGGTTGDLGVPSKIEPPIIKCTLVINATPLPTLRNGTLIVTQG